MNLINVKLPPEYAKKVFTSELNSYAYDYEHQAMVFLKDFSYGTDGSMQSSVEMYMLPNENPLSKNFTVTSPMIPGMKLIDVDNIESLEKMNDIILDFMNYCSTHTCVKTSTPLFNMDQPSSPPETQTKPQNKTIGPNDIVIPIPDTPINFEDPSKFDKE